jgi:hypothetical protein
MSDTSRKACHPPDAVRHEQARDVRARALSYVLHTYFSKQQAASASGGQNDPMGAKNEWAKRTLPP